jgi:hypothetical protein
MRAVFACAALLAVQSCVHHPKRAELHTYSRADALERSRQALATRYNSVNVREADLGRLVTEDRYDRDDPPGRSRAYLALAPGEFGWGVEITVIREVLDTPAIGLPFEPPARWAYDGRDREMEDYLAVALETWLPQKQPVFVESAPTRPAK